MISANGLEIMVNFESIPGRINSARMCSLHLSKSFEALLSPSRCRASEVVNSKVEGVF